MWADRLNRRRRQMKRLQSSRRRHRPYFRRGSTKASPGCGCQPCSQPLLLGPDKDGNTPLHLAVLTLRTRMHDAATSFSLTDLVNAHDTYSAGMRGLLWGGRCMGAAFRQLKLDDPLEDRKRINNAGWLPLHLLLSCESNVKLDLDVVEHLATKDTVNIPVYSTGQTSVHMAVQMCRVDILGVILGLGGSFCIDDISGETPLSLAVAQNRIDLLEMMANNDKDTFRWFLQNDPNLVTIPLFMRYRNAKKMLRYLLDNGAAVMHLSRMLGPMEIHCSALSNRVRVPERMLDRLVPKGGLDPQSTSRHLLMIREILHWERPAPDFPATLACVLWHFPEPYTFAMIDVNMFPFSDIVLSITPTLNSEPVNLKFFMSLVHAPIFLDILSELECWGPMRLHWFVNRDNNSVLKWETFINGKQQQFQSRKNSPSSLKRICLWSVRKMIRRVPRSRFDIVAELQLPAHLIEDLMFSKFVNGLYKVWESCTFTRFW